MNVGVYADGRTLDFDETAQVFTIGGTQVSYAQVAAYDQAGQLTWATQELRTWFYQVLNSAPATAPAPVRKRRTGIVVFVIVIILLLCCGFFAIGTLAPDDPSTSAPSSGSSTAPEETQVPQAIKVGQSFKTDKYEITVTSVETKDKVGSEFFESTPAEGGVYVTVQWKYKNITSEPINSFWESFNVKLIDPNGTEFSPDVDASGSFATEIDPTRKVVSDLNPGITVSGGKAFEVAKDSFSKDTWSLLVEGQKVLLK